MSYHVFNLSKKVLSQTEINMLEKGLGFSPTPSFINEADLRRDLRNSVERRNVNGILGMKPKLVRKSLHSKVSLPGIPQKVLQHLSYS